MINIINDNNNIKITYKIIIIKALWFRGVVAADATEEEKVLAMMSQAGEDYNPAKCISVAPFYYVLLSLL